MRLVNFGEVLEIKNGRNQKRVENPNGRYPIYGSGGIMGYADEYLCDAETIVLGRKGNINSPIFVEQPFWNVDTAFGLCANKDYLNPKYLYYFCQQFDFERLNTTVTIPSLTKTNLLEVKLPLPSLVEQRRIVAILDKAEDIRRKRRQSIVLIDDFLKSIFWDMFGDPVMNPKGWKISTFANLADSRLGKMLDGKQQTGSHQYPYLANYNVQWFSFNLTKLRVMDFDHKDREEFALKRGDILICEGGEIGRTAIWNCEIENCFFQKALHRVRCNQDVVTPEYIMYLMFFYAKNKLFDTLVGGAATIPHLTGKKLKELTIPLPPIKEQHIFSSVVKYTLTIKDNLCKKSYEADNLFKSIQMQLF